MVQGRVAGVRVCWVAGAPLAGSSPWLPVGLWVPATHVCFWRRSSAAPFCWAPRRAASLSSADMGGGGFACSFCFAVARVSRILEAGCEARESNHAAEHLRQQR